MNTPRDAILRLLDQERARFNSDAETAPVAILWPDKERQWDAIAPMLRNDPGFLTLGDYAPDQQTGPAIWIRTRLVELTRQPPVIYLPGYGIDDLRREEEAPDALRPILFVRFAGRIFLPPNSKDWTIAAFLQNSDRGLGIPVDGSAETRQLLIDALPELMERPIAELKTAAASHGAINAVWLRGLMVTDPVIEVLRWMSDPATYQAKHAGAKWNAFRGQMRADFQFDPEKETAGAAAARLGDPANSAWNRVWDRFCEIPDRFPHIRQLLLGAKPGATLFDRNYRFPQDNRLAEDELRVALTAVGKLGEVAAREQLRELNELHAERRDTVWAKLGEAPLAFAIEQLAVVAAAEQLPVADLTAIKEAYAEGGWQIDDAALRSQAAVSTTEDRKAVDAALAAVYMPWLRVNAERFQAAYQHRPVPSKPVSLDVPPGSCVLFIDGLRLDTAHRLMALLSDLERSLSIGIGAQPGITSSAKPAITPNASELVAGDGLTVREEADGPEVTKSVQDRLLKAKGWRLPGSGELDLVTGSERGWVEFTLTDGLDNLGHTNTSSFPGLIDQKLGLFADRIRELLGQGWQRVRVVTDHGWLYTPEPMPKFDLPGAVALAKEGRCARLKPGSTTSLQTIPWAWDATVQIAIAPDIHNFEANQRYEHGGLSPQECIVPDLTITSGSTAKATEVSITSVKWRGMRLDVQFTPELRGLQLDLRLKANVPESSVNGAPVPVFGSPFSLAILNDEHDGNAAFVVLLGPDGTVLAQHLTSIGGE